jgi:hypothetical protein
VIHPFDLVLLQWEDRMTLVTDMFFSGTNIASRIWFGLWSWLFVPLRWAAQYNRVALVETYTYQQLGGGQQQIRLLMVEKKTPFSSPSCSLLSLGLHETPPYEAISYTWDGQTPDQPLIVNGRCLRVTRNAWDIVRSRATRKTVRWLWIDAICINQEDTVEKSSQVAMMDKIYKGADRVIIWLENTGVTSSEALLAFSLVEAAGRRANSGVLQEGLASNDKLGSVRMWKALERLVTHNYWFRIWIIQEVAQARRVHILYGGIYFLWEDFAALAVKALVFGPLKNMVSNSMAATKSVDMHKFTLGIAQMQWIWGLTSLVRDQEHIELHRCLSSTAYFDSTDARDQIYGLYSLVSKGTARSGDMASIRPDYGEKVTDLYQRVGEVLLRECPNLAINRAGIGHEGSLLRLPSWVADWTSKREETGVHLLNYEADEYNELRYRAGGSDRFAFEIKDRSALRIRGIMVGSVIELSVDRYPYFELLKLIQQGSGLLWKTWSKEHVHNFAQLFLTWHDSASRLADKIPDVYPLTGQLRAEVLWRTLLGDRVSIAMKDQLVHTSTVPDGFPAPDEFAEHYRTWWNWMHDDVDQGKGDREWNTEVAHRSNAEAKLFMIALDVSRQEGRFALLDGGLLAKVPPLSAPGDRICVVPGLAKPLLLRPAERIGDWDGEDSSTWELVGECYLHGVMRGEALEWGKEYEDVVIL